MKKGSLYKHNNGRDVAILPLDIRLSTRGIYKIKVRWFNIVDPDHIFDMGCPDRIEVKKEDIRNWKIFQD